MSKKSGFHRQIWPKSVTHLHGITLERKNRIVQEESKTILNEANLSDAYWKEEVYTDVYILNRGQIRLNKDKTPYELWYGRIDGFLLSLGFTKSKADSNLYYKVDEDGILILLLYVDDLFLTGEVKSIIECKKRLAIEFEMKDLGMMHYFLELEVWQHSDEIFLNQGKYTVEILKRFGMLDCKDMTTSLKLLNDDTSKAVDATLYRQIIGSLMYLTNTRPDICFALNTLSQYMVNPKHILT